MKGGHLYTRIESGNGMITNETSRSLEEVVHALQEILAEKGIQLFSIIDHSGEAAKVGLEMPPTKLLIFGNPKLGSLAMIASPSSALDLPLKILVAETAAGVVQLTYNSASYLQSRHGIPDHVTGPLGVVDDLANMVL